MTEPRFKSCRGALWVAAIILPAIVPLLWRPHSDFGPDWPSHLYPIGYQGYYLRQHHWFNETLNADWAVGMPYPIFYAFLFYPVAAVLAAFVGADWAVRVLAIALLALQTWQVRKLLHGAGGNDRLNWLAAATLAWATYALTNLYTRGAIAEFVAVSLLISATAGLLRSALPGESGSRARLAFQGAFFYALSAGTHPITALFGTLFLGGVLPPLFLASWRKILGPLLAGAFVAMLMLAPWFYLLAKFRGTTTVERESMTEVTHFTDSIDSVQSRLWPWPRDLRITPGKVLEEGFTPYLDAQLSMPLLLLAAAVSLWMWNARTRVRRAASDRIGLWLMGVSWGIFLVAFLLSVCPAPWNWLPRLLRSVQYGYRLVTYQNLALLTAMAGALLAMPVESRKNPPAGSRWTELALWLVATGGMAVMLSHVLTIQRSPRPDTRRQISHPDNYVYAPSSFYGWAAYSILGANAETNQPVRTVHLFVGTGEHFGQVSPTKFELESPTNVCLQVQPFPWNKLYLDGQPLDESRARTRPAGYAVQLAAGTHGVSYLWQPDVAWVWLDLLSKFATLLGGATVVALALREARRPAQSDGAVPQKGRAKVANRAPAG